MAIIITGPYTAYLAAVAAKRNLEGARKRADTACSGYYREIDLANEGHVHRLDQAAKLHADASVKAHGALIRVYETSSDLRLERDLAREDWIPCN